MDNAIDWRLCLSLGGALSGTLTLLLLYTALRVTMGQWPAGRITGTQLSPRGRCPVTSQLAASIRCRFCAALVGYLQPLQALTPTH